MIELDHSGPDGKESAPSSSAVQTVEVWFTVVLTIAMVILPVLEVVLRAIRGEGVPGGSKYVQHLMVWLGFTGAVIATGGGKHLGLATGSFLKPGPRRTAIQIFTHVISAVVCMVLTWASYGVVKANAQSDDFLAGGIPVWWSEVIVPVSMAAMTVRFILATPSWAPAEGRGGRSPGKWLRGRLISLAACVVAAPILWFSGAHAAGLLWPLMLVLFVAFLLGAPVFVAMAGAAMLLFWSDGSPIASVPQESLRLAEKDALPAIPLLTMIGFVLAAGGASARIVRAYKSLFGWMPGGVALMVIGVCALFTTFTGGSGVTILALGGLMLPALVQDKYPPGFSLGLVTASGSLGLLFPPSLPVILYGVIAGISTNALFVGGLLPGVLLILVVSAYAIRVGIQVQAPRQKFELREVGRALWAAKFDLGLPLLVLVVFVAGWATIVEAAALGGAYALLIELFVFREVHPTRELPKVLAQSATLVGAVIVLMGMALGFTNYLIDAQIGEALTDWAQAHIHSQWAFLLALNGMLLVLGSVFEIYAAIIVLAPLVAPLGVAFHVEPVHLGVVFLANLELGFLFPPMGLNLFLSASRFGKPLPYLYRQALPFLFILAIGVLVITYVPAMTTGVVHLLIK
jgi:tripartite ATP-independent transporter DctM subunit